MSNRCEDCGCGLNSGVCSNCHEELYIIQYQGDCIDQPLSQDFRDKAEEQRIVVKERLEQQKEVERKKLSQDNVDVDSDGNSCTNV